MKYGRIAPVLILCTAVTFLSGCSFIDSAADLLHKVTSGDNIQNDDGSKGDKENWQLIDPSVAKPEFAADERMIYNVQVGAPVRLETAATVSDGGSVSYQWYSNNVDSNGGGKKIEDADSSSYEADTSEGGTTFYYAVATNTVSGRVNKSTSLVYEVTVWDDMYWQQNADLGAYQFMSRIDGRYPVATKMTIDGTEYLFDQDGFAINDEGLYIDILTGLPQEKAVGEEPEPTPTPTPEPEPETEETAAEEEAEAAPEAEGEGEEAPADEAAVQMTEENADQTQTVDDQSQDYAE